MDKLVSAVQSKMNLLSAAGYLLLILTAGACYFLFKIGEWQFALGLTAFAAYMLLKIMNKVALARGPTEGRMTPRVALRVLVGFTLMCVFLCIVIFGGMYASAELGKKKSLYRQWCAKQGFYYDGRQGRHVCHNAKTGEIIPLPDLNLIREQLQ